MISTSHCVAKNAKRDAGAFHLCYCHTPVRYLHDQFDDYFRGRPAPVVLAARLARAPLAAWDRRDRAPRRRVPRELGEREGPDRAALGTRRRGGRFPPVDTEFYTPPPPGRRARGLLVVSALAPYKRLDDAIDGRERPPAPPHDRGVRAGARAGSQARPVRRCVFPDTPNDDMLRELYRAAEAVLMPGEEDFGIVPLEAQACGTPVVALGRGGALETVRDGETGVLYARAGSRRRFSRPSTACAACGSTPPPWPRTPRRFSRGAFREPFRAALEAARAASAATAGS